MKIIAFVIAFTNLIHISLCEKPEIKLNQSGTLAENGSDDEGGGFIKSIWAAFLFAIIGIVVFVALLFLLLKYACGTRTSKTTNPAKSYGDGNRRTSDQSTIERDIEEAYQKRTVSQPQQNNFAYQPPPPQSGAYQSYNQDKRNFEASPPVSPYSDKSDVQKDYGYDNRAFSISGEHAASPSIPTYNVNPAINSQGTMETDEPFGYLDKYSGYTALSAASTTSTAWTSIDKEIQMLGAVTVNNDESKKTKGPPVPPKRAVLRNNTPYRKIEETTPNEDDADTPTQPTVIPAHSTPESTPQNKISPTSFISAEQYVPAPDYYDDKPASPPNQAASKFLYPQVPAAPPPDYDDAPVTSNPSFPAPPPAPPTPVPVMETPIPPPESAARSHSAAIPHKFVRVLPRHPPPLKQLD